MEAIVKDVRNYMTQEDKELFNDLSRRLPYRIIVKTPYNVATLIGIISRKRYKKDEYYIDAITDKQTYPIRYIQPYLRPISSMTDKELTTFLEIRGMNLKSEELQSFREGRTAIVSTLPSYSRHIDWLNANHFDYRGLIEKGLAIEVTKENNPYKD